MQTPENVFGRFIPSSQPNLLFVLGVCWSRKDTGQRIKRTRTQLSSHVTLTSTLEPKEPEVIVPQGVRVHLACLIPDQAQTRKACKCLRNWQGPCESTCITIIAWNTVVHRTKSALHSAQPNFDFSTWLYNQTNKGRVHSPVPGTSQELHGSEVWLLQC